MFRWKYLFIYEWWSWGGVNTPAPQDPVRWWPTAVPQTWTVLFGIFSSYKVLSRMNPRLRVIASFGTVGNTLPSIILNQIVEIIF